MARKEDSQKTFDHMIRVGGDSAHLHFLLGKAYLDLYQNEQAREELEKTVSLDPKLGFAHFNLGVVYQRMGRFQEAAQAFDTEMTLTPHEPWSYENRGEVCLDLNQWDQAIKFFQQALARQPKLPKSLAGLGKAYVQKGDTAQGIRYLKEAIALDPGAASYHYQIGPGIPQGRPIPGGCGGVGDHGETSGCGARETSRPVVWKSSGPLITRPGTLNFYQTNPPPDHESRVRRRWQVPPASR